MGEIIPPIPFVIDPAMVYCCKMSAWFGDGGCGGDFAGTTHCCVEGVNIINWLAGGNECKMGFGICAFLGWAPQRIEVLDGPYAPGPDCVASGCLVF